MKTTMKTTGNILVLAALCLLSVLGTVRADGPEPNETVYRAAAAGEAQLKQLLRSGLTVDAVDEDGKTALMEAADDGDVAAIQLLVRCGARINLRDEDGETALMKAADEGRTAAVSALLALGADPSLRDRKGRTALDLARKEGHIDTARVLEAAVTVRPAAANPIAPGGRQAALVGKAGQKAVLRAAYSGESTLKDLLAGGTSVDCAARDGETALMEAADKGNLGMVQMLIRNGARVNMQDSDGKTALMEAADAGHTAVVQALLAAGADADIMDEDRETALTKAQKEHHADTAAVLRAAGAR